jgi:hypothetical protein
MRKFITTQAAQDGGYGWSILFAKRDKLLVCFQLMETDDRVLLDQWIGHWVDLVDFEVFPVITSSEAAGKVLPND